MCQPALNSKPTKARGAMTRCKASSDECWAVRLTDRAKLRATRRPAQGCGTKSVPRQGHNTPLPLERSPPGSFKRLLGGKRRLLMSVKQSQECPRVEAKSEDPKRDVHSNRSATRRVAPGEAPD